MARGIAALLLVATVAALAGHATAAPRAAGRGPTPVTRPRIDGVPEIGAQLTARSGWWKGVRPLHITYRWQRCGPGGCLAVALGRTYTVRPADATHVLRVLVRVRNGGGSRSATSKTTTAVVAPPTVDAAGDIACDPTSTSFVGGAGKGMNCREQATSDLIVADQPTAVLPLGDDQYECGRADAFAASYDPSWGRVKSVTHPAIGNHEYGTACHTNDPSPYFDYFGAAAGTRYQGWYSYDLGTWHLIALNSECNYGRGSEAVGGCGPGSPEETWLRRDLETHPSRCTLAYWHEPRFSSGEHGDAQQMATIWNDLVAAHVDVVLSGHNHDYERFDPIGSTPQGTDLYQSPNLDPNGIREFVVGTGGRNTYSFRNVPPLNGEIVRNASTFGVLHLTLEPVGYEWRFEPIAGESFTDSGSGTCN
jgi:hypothetical protein